MEEHKIRVPFVNSHDNLADFFTKALSSVDFFRLRNIIMNVLPESRRDSPKALQLRGGVERRRVASEPYALVRSRNRRMVALPNLAPYARGRLHMVGGRVGLNAVRRYLSRAV